MNSDEKNPWSMSAFKKLFEDINCMYKVKLQQRENASI